jgi:hypothetical protein
MYEPIGEKNQDSKFGGVMGKEMYDALVSYCGSVEQSLAAAQRETFESGDYEDPELGEDLELEFLIGLAPDVETYSVLDVRGVSAQPRESYTAPFSSTELESHLGTSQPTADQLDEHDDLEDLWTGERGYCRHIVLFRDGRPDQVYFWGWSYD